MTEIKPDSSEPPRLGGATQIDVARRAGVSTATVSRVLNGSPLVSRASREKVEAAIRELAYMPHEAARSLATRRSRTLGAVIPTLTNAIFAAGVNAFEDEARRRGHALFIAVSNYDPVQEGFLIRQMVERGVDGLLLVGNDRGAEGLEMLVSSGLRCACAWAYDEAAPLANIGFDNAAAMAPLVDHLVASGRRRVAILAGVLAGNDRARARLDGTVARLADHGLAPVAVAETLYSIRRAKEAARALLEVGPDAVVCGNDVIALGALAAARAAGLGVPDDVAITGVDDLPISAEMDPPLTTVRIPAEEMGRRAAAELIAAIKEDRPVSSIRLGTRLVVRRSSWRKPGAS
ncbi:LacI family DNA-binding transcriptional regulator [Salinarimonas rosea]|uniref:LacI family DNA-binding transcriptional regulator n=1 Tax=Salinarimonas rosea TaxID=552063 RepID=UPI00042762E2|nr:LacI family DNA-binding transcriptional regulator [Salinarimonas rosea]